MVFYHIDRSGAFPENAEDQLHQAKAGSMLTKNTVEANKLFESLYPQGIGQLGERYLDVFDDDISALEKAELTRNNFRVFTIEYIFEIVRLIKFPQWPSRFTSLFACKYPKDVMLWYDMLKENTPDIDKSIVRMVEVEPGKYFVGDAFWRDQQLTFDERPVFSPFAFHCLAEQYWAGCQHPGSENSKWEVLCKLPVAVKTSVPIVDFLRQVK